ncbi:unnamed protein product [Caenorhabditis auriculariae]|uniref:Protein disulfide-isomerase A6 homolog n=1 Tax=Caenorhabditis auriculariae TaxID=2777116 RepID=A0A8S1GNU8_9PELO|nr:unnamed protein product [Caenorhabditis auriculariae]
MIFNDKLQCHLKSQKSLTSGGAASQDFAARADRRPIGVHHGRRAPDCPTLNMLPQKLVLIALAIGACSAMYSKKDDVVELTEANFQSKVLASDDIWIVEFYAPWCGHCKNLVPEYKKAATALKGVAKVGAVDMTQHQSVGQPYNVQGFPTLKIFGADKKKPTDFNGQRTAQAIADALLAEAKKAVSARLGGKGSSGSSSSGSGSGSGKRGGGNEVVELTDSNFEELVLNSKDMWLVEFYAPWCGHCKNLEPHWKAAASELKGKVKLGALDATVHTNIANKFGIRGFPTIKYFAPGSDISDAAEYDGGRTTSDIVSWASSKAQENLPPPEVLEGINQEVVEGACKDKQLCIFAFLPHILDCQSECRNKHIAVLKELSEKFKKNLWGWIWVEGGSQPGLEEAFEVGGFGYPAMTALNSRKMKFSVLKGSFSKDGIHEFLRDLSFGKGRTASLRSTEFPKVVKTEKWDGKDGVLPAEDDIDLSDIDLDKTEL